MRILSIKVDCVFGCYLEEPVYKVCEIDSDMSLDDLCYFILDSFDFDDDHLHEFFVGRNFRNAGYRIEDGSLTLDEIFPLDKGHYLFMNFDFGDNWMFKISLSRKKANDDSQLTYPRVVETVGKNPEQYPMYEEYN